jgi:hypothetical protein
MKLKESQTLWGIPIVHLKEHSKKYKLYSSILYICDILLILGLTTYMFFNNINYNSYGFVLVSVCVLFHCITYAKLNPEKWEAFKFYKKHMSCELKEKTYDLDENKLYSILYCTGYRRLKQNKSLNDYKELMLSACCENIKYSSSIMKYINKYESESGNLTCIIIEKGKKQYFIDFKQNDGGNDSDGNDNEGTTSETDSRTAD